MAEIQATIATGLIKTSVCLFILRIIKGTHRRPSNIIIAFIVINILETLAFLFVICFQCTPFNKVWKPTIQGHCTSPTISSRRKQRSRRCNTKSPCSLAHTNTYPSLHLPHRSILLLHPNRTIPRPPNPKADQNRIMPRHGPRSLVRLFSLALQNVSTDGQPVSPPVQSDKS